MKLKNVKEVAEWRLCLGCGACAYICPERNIKLLDVVTDGIRPILHSNNCKNCEECLKVCPGYKTVHPNLNGTPSLIPGLKEKWGPILEVWEGYAADPDIRLYGSSGGIASNLALYCIEKEGMHGVLHTGANQERPYQNITVFSRNRADILSRTGSRYSPASPCDGLGQIESSSGPCVFIGKPCDVTGLRNALSLRSGLDKKIGVAIGIFCAGTPSTIGTLKLFKSLNIDHEKVSGIRYRGKGWPGETTVRLKSETLTKSISYMEAWGFLQKFRPYRCYLCPDGTSEFADISCGDPWYRKIQKDEQGYSLVLVRTERGQEILHRAMKAGFVTLERAEPTILELSQKNLFLKRGSISGRLIVMKAFGIPTPRLHGFYLFKNWLRLPFIEKLRSILGTVKRIIQRGYCKPEINLYQ